MRKPEEEWIQSETYAKFDSHPGIKLVELGFKVLGWIIVIVGIKAVGQKTDSDALYYLSIILTIPVIWVIFMRISYLIGPLFAPRSSKNVVILTQGATLLVLIPFLFWICSSITNGIIEKLLVDR